MIHFEFQVKSVVCLLCLFSFHRFNKYEGKPTAHVVQDNALCCGVCKLANTAAAADSAKICVIFKPMKGKSN